MTQEAVGRIVIVTGAARRLGAVVARHLAGQGWRVVIHHHRSEAEAVGLADELVEAGRHAVAIEGDLALPDPGDVLVAAARAAFGGPVSGLVNNASLFAHDDPSDVTSAAIDRHMAVNLSAPSLLAAAVARQDDLGGDPGSGAIVNILDQKIANLNPDFYAYTCSKLALAGATRMLAQAFGPRISVNAVSPGLTLPSLDQTEAEFRAVAAINLLQRPVDPQAIAQAVGFLLSSRGISGQNIFVDNGQRFLPRARDVMFATRDLAGKAGQGAMHG